MTHPLNAAIARLLTADGTIVGTGFLITDRHIVTCAHVVEAALEMSLPQQPQTAVSLDLPQIASGHVLSAHSVCWQAKHVEGSGDIAILELNSPPPPGASPLSLLRAANLWGHSFRALGFPALHDHGAWATGVLRDRVANGRIQIEDIKAPGYRIQPGFSGAPVWDETLQGVVGMVVTAEIKADVKAAFIIPAEMIFSAWTELAAAKPLKPSKKSTVRLPEATTQKPKSTISSETPLLIGLVIDVSGSMIQALHKNQSLSQKDLQKAVNQIVDKTVQFCKTDPLADEVLPQCALFAYGYGFGSLRQGLRNIAARIGFSVDTARNLDTEPIRDLFASVDDDLRLPRTPDAQMLHVYGEAYKQAIFSQITDTGLGPSLLLECLQQVYNRLQEELRKPYYQQPVLLLISDGEVNEDLSDEIELVITAIKHLGVQIVCAYVAAENVLDAKTLYVSAQSHWPREALRLFELASATTEAHQSLANIVTELSQRGWRVPSGSKWFFQINQAHLLTELVDSLLDSFKD
jgi:hypothetical protein